MGSVGRLKAEIMEGLLLVVSKSMAWSWQWTAKNNGIEEGGQELDGQGTRRISYDVVLKLCCIL